MALQTREHCVELLFRKPDRLVCCAHLQELVGIHVDGNDALSLRHHSTLNDAQTDTAETEHGNRRAGLDLRRV